MELEGAKVLVVGMKRSGMAAASLLTSQKAIVRATDLQTLEALPEARELLERLAIPFETQSPAVFEGCGIIVISPDVPADLPVLVAARERGVQVIGDLELAAPLLKGMTIGVTGSNGKTTTTSLIGHILRESGVDVQVGGNIGTPVSAMVANSRRGQWNVLELSSFQLETISTFRAHVGVALNVTQNHLDRHHTFEQYAAAKARLFEMQRAGDTAVLNADDPVCTAFAASGRATVRWFSLLRRFAPGACMGGEEVLLDGRPLIGIRDIPIRGRHNIQNVMAAAIAASRAGVSREDIGAAVSTFRAVEHRLEFVRAIEGVDFYNDSKATSVDATLKALDAFPGGLWVILGGKDKGLNYTPLREPLAQKAHASLLIGAAAGKIASQLEGAVPLVDSKTLEEAVAYAWQRAVSGDTILLAPACASFDQFRGFEHRGETFKELVMGLTPRSSNGPAA
jgi:UDP-N-acetylmuramoylalanine--D-glutamate ligase